MTSVATDECIQDLFMQISYVDKHIQDLLALLAQGDTSKNQENEENELALCYKRFHGLYCKVAKVAATEAAKATEAAEAAKVAATEAAAITEVAAAAEAAEVEKAIAEVKKDIAEAAEAAAMRAHQDFFILQGEPDNDPVALVWAYMEFERLAGSAIDATVNL